MNNSNHKYILSGKRRAQGGILVAIPNRAYSDNLLLNTVSTISGPLALLLNRVCPG